MRVSIVSETTFPQINGVSRTLDKLVRHLLAQGDSVQLVAPRYAGGNQLSDGNLESRRFRAFALPGYRDIKLVPAWPARLRTALDVFCPDIVHIATEGPLGLAALCAARTRGLPVVTSYHTNFPDYLSAYRCAFLQKTAWRYLRWFHNSGRVTFCPTASLRESLSARGFSDVQVWSRGVDTTHFAPTRRDEVLRRTCGAGADDVLLVHVGRLAAEKNLHVLMEAFRALPNTLPVRLLIVGEGPLRGELEQGADERVVFAGWWKGEALARLYACADVFVFPSLTDTFGNVVLEGMASGLPAVAFRTSGPGDIVRHGETGLLVEPKTARALSAALAGLAGDADRRRRLGQAARAYAETQHWDTINGTVRETYLELLSTRRASSRAHAVFHSRSTCSMVSNA